MDELKNVNEKETIIEKETKKEKERDLWECPVCHKRMDGRGKGMHQRKCTLPTTTPQPEAPKEAPEVQREIVKEPSKEKALDGYISKVVEKPKTAKTIKEAEKVDEIVESPMTNFILKLIIVGGIIAGGALFVIKAMANRIPQPTTTTTTTTTISPLPSASPAVPSGFTDSRGVFYSPGEFCHERS